MLKIVSDKIKSLREKSIEVQIPLSSEDEKLLLKMVEYLKLSQDPEYAKKHNIREGVGLAAPQVGVNKRMIAIHYLNENEKTISYALVNPKIISNSVRKAYLSAGEGCLSVNDEHKGYAIRDYKIVVKAYDLLQKADVEITARGFDAIVLQHEIDHLDGILFYDRINKEQPFKEIGGAYII